MSKDAGLRGVDGIGLDPTIHVADPWLLQSAASVHCTRWDTTKHSQL